MLRSELAGAEYLAGFAGNFIGDSSRQSVASERCESSRAPDWIDIVIPMTGPPPPYLVEEGDRSLSLLLYGVTNAPVVSMMPQPVDSYLNSVSSTPEPTRVRFGDQLEPRAVRVPRPLAERHAHIQSQAPSPDRGSGVSSSRPHHHRRSRSSTRGRDRADRTVRSRCGAGGWTEASRSADGAWRKRGDDAHHLRSGRSRAAADNQPPRECTCLRLDPPERLSRWRQSVRQQRHHDYLFLAALETARGADAASARGRARIARQSELSIENIAVVARNVDAIDSHRGSVRNHAGSGSGVEDARLIRRRTPPRYCTDWRRTSHHWRDRSEIVRARSRAGLLRGTRGGRTASAERRLADDPDAAFSHSLHTRARSRRRGVRR